MDATVPESFDRVHPTRLELFTGFLGLSMFAFGGVLPWAHHVIVYRRRWMDEHEFNEVVSLGQFLPGPNIVNVAITVGARFHGATGAVAAFLGLLALPVAVALALGMIYARFAMHPEVGGAFSGIAAAAPGLVAALAFRMARPLLRRHAIFSVAMMAAAFAAVAIAGLSLVYVLALLVPLGLAIASRLPRP